MSLEGIIREKIRAEGPMGIDAYMSLALTHPQFGYYTTHRPIGAAGDFITSPEISQIFGELTGIWCADIWQKSGGGEMALVELGPGRGTLMRDALRATRHVQGFHEAIAVHLVEVSPVLRAQQAELLKNSHANIHWHDSIDALPVMPRLVIANEFFDALPVRQFVKRAPGWAERCVGLAENNTLQFIEKSASGIEDDMPEGTVIERCADAERIMQILAGHTARHGGGILAIDYGYEQGAGDTLQAVRAHQPAGFLENPGENDLTAHVDFGRLKHAAQAAGAAVHGPVTQGRFLLQMGAAARAQALLKNTDPKTACAILGGLERLVSPDQMGTLFLALAVTQQGITPAGL